MVNDCIKPHKKEKKRDYSVFVAISQSNAWFCVGNWAGDKYLQPEKSFGIENSIYLLQNLEYFGSWGSPLNYIWVNPKVGQISAFIWLIFNICGKHLLSRPFRYHRPQHLSQKLHRNELQHVVDNNLKRERMYTLGRMHIKSIIGVFPLAANEHPPDHRSSLVERLERR